MKILNKGLRTHSKSDCDGPPCCIHSPSNHKMNDWPIFIRLDKYGLAERVCEHGVGHPDPDSLMYLQKHPFLQGDWLGSHGCDGCCTETTKKSRRSSKP